MLSIIIGIHQPKRDMSRLKHVLNSFYNQTCQDFEIVINLQGTHTMRDIIADIINGHPKVKLLYNTIYGQMNLSKLWNDGMVASSGEFISIWNTDCIAKPNYVQTVLDTVTNDNFLVCLPRLTTKATAALIRPHNIASWNFPHDYKYVGTRGACGMASFSRKFFAKSKGFDERQVGLAGMDESIMKRAKLGGYEVVWIEDKTDIIHLWHPSRKPGVTKQMQNNWKMRDEATNINWKK